MGGRAAAGGVAPSGGAGHRLGQGAAGAAVLHARLLQQPLDVVGGAERPAMAGNLDRADDVGLPDARGAGHTGTLRVRPRSSSPLVKGCTDGPKLTCMTCASSF